MPVGISDDLPLGNQKRYYAKSKLKINEWITVISVDRYIGENVANGDWQKLRNAKEGCGRMLVLQWLKEGPWKPVPKNSQCYYSSNFIDFTWYIKNADRGAFSRGLIGFQQNWKLRNF